MKCGTIDVNELSLEQVIAYFEGEQTRVGAATRTLGHDSACQDMCASCALKVFGRMYDLLGQLRIALVFLPDAVPDKRERTIAELTVKIDEFVKGRE